MSEETARALEKKTLVLLPFEKVRLSHGGRSVVVEAIIDTGATYSTVSFAVLKKLGIPVAKLITVGLMRGAKGTHKAFSILVDRVELEDTECGVSPFRLHAIETIRMPGQMLLGMDFLKAIKAQLDFRRRAFLIKCFAKEGKARGTGRILLPFIFRNKGVEIERLALVDTGATNIFLPAAFARKLKIEPIRAEKKALAIGVSVTVKHGKLESVQLKGTPCHFGPFLAVILDVPFPTPIIGTSFLIRANAVIDLVRDVEQLKINCP